MMEKYHLLQNISLIIIFIGVILGGIGSYGWNFYGKKIAALKSKEQNQSTELTTSKILEHLDTSTAQIIKHVDSSGIQRNEKQNNKSKMQENKKTEKEVTHINAPNASIVTSNQSGGNNTVVNNYGGLETPTVSNSGWTVVNEKVSQIEDPIRREMFSIREKFGSDTLFFNEIKLGYRHSVILQEIGFRVKKKGIKHAAIIYSGPVLMSKNGYNEQGDYMFIVGQPGNGIYTLRMYSDHELTQLEDAIDYLLPPEAMPKNFNTNDQ